MIIKKHLLTISAMCLFCMIFVCGCKANIGSSSADSSDAEADLSSERSVFAMDTYMTLTAYGSAREDALDAAIAEIQRLEALFNAEDPDSEISQLNENGEATVSKDTGYLIGRSLELYDSTGGLFDIAIYPLMQAWGFTTQDFAVPEEDTISGLLKYTDASRIEYDPDALTVRLPENMRIDPGGIAKGYTSASVVEIFEEYGITAGVVSLGGNVQVYGNKADGSPWNIAIRDPDTSSGDYLGVLALSAPKAVITSGGYERYFEENGITYHHILDPRTGYPASSGLTSVTIVSSDGTLADGLSTALFIMGKDDAVSYWRSHADEFDFILLDDTGEIYISEGIEDIFSSDLYDINTVYAD